MTASAVPRTTARLISAFMRLRTELGASAKPAIGAGIGAAAEKEASASDSRRTIARHTLCKRRRPSDFDPAQRHITLESHRELHSCYGGFATHSASQVDDSSIDVCNRHQYTRIRIEPLTLDRLVERSSVEERVLAIARLGKPSREDL